MEVSAGEENSVNETMEIFTQEDSENDRMEENEQNPSVSSQSKKSENPSNNAESGSKDENESDVVTRTTLANDEIDDGESSVDSFSSSSSLSSEASTSSEASLTLMERQARNIARNERFLGSLREKYEGQLGTIQPPGHQQQDENEEEAQKQSSTEFLQESEDEKDSRTKENLGMVRKGSHRLFQVSLPPEPLGANDRNDDVSNEEESFVRACQNYAFGIQMLQEKYPHRGVQIGKLHAILSSTVSLTASIAPRVVPSSAASVYVPAPIFCMGSKGTGKTSVVCDVLGLLSSRAHNASSLSHQQARVQPAYVDCSIVEPSTIERLVYTIYKQLKPSSSSIGSNENRRSQGKHKIKQKPSKKRKRRFRPPPRAQGQDDSNVEQKGDNPSEAAQAQHQEDEANQPRVLPSRKAKKAAIHKSLASNATTYQNVQKQRDNNYDSNDDENDDDSDEEAVATLHSAVLSLGRSLQKHYGSYLDDNGAYNNKSFRKNPKCGVLVLDKAEELLSLSSASKKGTTGSSGGANNYLSELLLLPKIMKLNLTIVVITNYCTLHMTRLNNASDPSKALGTISNGVHPIIVQFPAYKGNKVFTEILSTKENQKLVMGDSLCPLSNSTSAMRQTLKDKLVRSFWNTVVQFASDSTRDIRDFQRLGRALWPSFVAPLHPSVLKATLTAAANKLGVGTNGLTRKGLSDAQSYTKMEDEIVRILGNKFYPMVSSLASGDDSLTLLTLGEDGSLPVVLSQSSNDECGRRIVQSANLGATPSVPQPYLRSCLLLAAFVCQHNKADQDRKLFSVHGNGKRRKSRAKEDLYGGNDEDLAFGSTSVSMLNRGRGRKAKQDGQHQPHQVEQLRSLKLRPVPLERVFSIFVTLVRLNPTNGGSLDEGNDDEENLEATMDDLGSSRLYRDLSHLMELGYLQLVKANQMLHSAPSRVLCTLTREEAVEISNRIGIPLERYLL